MLIMDWSILEGITEVDKPRHEGQLVPPFWNPDHLAGEWEIGSYPSPTLIHSTQQLCELPLTCAWIGEERVISPSTE